MVTTVIKPEYNPYNLLKNSVSDVVQAKATMQALWIDLPTCLRDVVSVYVHVVKSVRRRRSLPVDICGAHS